MVGDSPLTDSGGIPLAISLTGGHRNDVIQLLPLIDGVGPVRGKVGRPRQRAERLVADRGYDHDKYRRELWKRGVKPINSSSLINATPMLDGTDAASLGAAPDRPRPERGEATGRSRVLHRRRDATSSDAPYVSATEFGIRDRVRRAALKVRDYGFDGGYDTVRRYVERARPRPARSEVRFETAPGFQAQVDWSHEEPIRTGSGLELPLYCFHMVLGHSRDSFCALTGSQDLVTFWVCHRQVMLGARAGTVNRRRAGQSPLEEHE